MRQPTHHPCGTTWQGSASRALSTAQLHLSSTPPRKGADSAKPKSGRRLAASGFASMIPAMVWGQHKVHSLYLGVSMPHLCPTCLCLPACNTQQLHCLPCGDTLLEQGQECLCDLRQPGRNQALLDGSSVSAVHTPAHLLKPSRHRTSMPQGSCMHHAQASSSRSRLGRAT